MKEDMMTDEKTAEEVEKPVVLLTVDDIRKKDDTEFLVIQAWGGHMRLQSITAGDFIEWSEAGEDEAAKRTAGLRLIIKSAVDADGRLLFTPKHLGMLREKNHKQTEQVVKEIITLNGLKVKGADAKNS